MPVTLSLPCFDPVVILESGQCFRMIAPDSQTVETVALGRCLRIHLSGAGRFTFDCDLDTFNAVWRPYFDLDTDYAAICAAAPAADVPLQQALACMAGLRILRQDPWETLCGFILSQRRHIRAIRANMEALSKAFGEPIEGSARNAFPTAERLAAQSEAALRALGLGYRAPYVLDAARRVASGRLNLQALSALPDEPLFAALRTVAGVGVKVADCVMLFGYRRLARAPVDVWIRRVIDESYGGEAPFAGYGAYAGIYQQYLFMHRRKLGAAAKLPPVGKAEKTSEIPNECSKKTAAAIKRKP
jgi:N-glycosylase/DNA lyase